MIQSTIEGFANEIRILKQQSFIKSLKKKKNTDLTGKFFLDQMTKFKQKINTLA